ncbi:kinetochore-associated Ndc80 complex subunit ndc80 [Saitoella coloradoensis]
MAPQAGRMSLAPPRFGRSSSGGDLAGMAGGRLSSSQGDPFRQSMGMRQSYAPAASGGRRSSVFTGGRQSIAGGMSGGFLSQSGSASATMKPKDPRPLKDRAFQQQTIENIMNYLARSNFPHDINPKGLAQPTNKDFNNVFKWLYNALDPNYQFVKKMEDEVIQCLKGIRYPFYADISRTAIQAVGNSNTWPPLLGMLGWLCDIVSATENIAVGELQSQIDPADSTASEKLFFDYLTQAYADFLAGADEFDAQQAELTAEFDRRNGEVLGEIEKLEKEVAETEAALKKLNEDQPPLDTLNNERQVLTSDKQKFEKYIEHVEGKKKKFTEYNARMREEIVAKEQEIKQLAAEKSELQAQVDAQPVSPAEVDRMTAEREKLIKDLDIVQNKSDEISKVLYDREIASQKRAEVVEKLISTYNTFGYRIGVIPETAPHANGHSFELDLTAEQEDGSVNTRPDKMVNRDLRHEIRPLLTQLRADMGGKVHAQQNESLRLDDILGRVCEGLQDKRDELDTLEAKIASLVEESESLKETSAAESTRSNVDAEKLERELQHVRLHAQAGVLAIEQRAQAVAIEYDTLAQEANERREEMYTQVIKVLDEVIKFKLYVQSGLETLETEVLEEQEAEMTAKMESAKLE